MCTHGRNENTKMAKEKTCFLSRHFVYFPRMQKHPAGGVPPPSPWAGGSATSNSQKHFLLLQTCFCVQQIIPQVSAGYCLSVTPSNYRCWVQGRWPCWGLRGQRPSGSPTLQREIVCWISHAISATGSRGVAPSGFLMYQRETVGRISHAISASGSRGNAPGGCRDEIPGQSISITPG